VPFHFITAYLGPRDEVATEFKRACARLRRRPDEQGLRVRVLPVRR